MVFISPIAYPGMTFNPALRINRQWRHRFCGHPRPRCQDSRPEAERSTAIEVVTGSGSRRSDEPIEMLGDATVSAVGKDGVQPTIAFVVIASSRLEPHDQGKRSSDGRALVSRGKLGE